MKALSRQFLHFAAVGLVGTAVQYLTLWIGVEYWGWAAAVASALGYVLGALTNYALNYKFTFKSNASHGATASKFFTVVAIGGCLNTALMALLAHVLDWQYFVAQILTTALGLIWNFAGSRLWAFRERKHER